VITYRILKCVCVVVCIFIFSSCVSNGHIVGSQLDKDGNPLWVSTGSQSVINNNRRSFQGVGKATLSSDLSKQISLSDRRAKAEINKLLASYIKMVSRSYIASGRAQKSGFDHFQASQQISVITEYNIHSIKVIAHWQDNKNKAVYSIAELDLSTVKTTLKPGLINNGFISYFDIEGNKLFDRFASIQ